MAKKISQDKLQSFRFRPVIIDGSPVLSSGVVKADFVTTDGVDAGFKTCTLPNVTFEVTEMRTGTKFFTEKQPGIPTVGDAQMTKGLVKKDSQFYDWMRAYQDGKEYRADIQVNIFDAYSAKNITANSKAVAAAIVREAFPTDIKIFGDTDASASDINTQEITFTVEEVEQAWPT